MSMPEENRHWDDLLADLGLPGEPAQPAEIPAPAEKSSTEPVEAAPVADPETAQRRGRKRASAESAPETPPEVPAPTLPVSETESEESEGDEETSGEGEKKRRRRRGRRKKKAGEAAELVSESSEGEPTAEPTDDEIVEVIPDLMQEPVEDEEEFEQEQGLEEPIELREAESEGEEAERKRRRRRRRKKKGTGTATEEPAASPRRTIVAPEDLAESEEVEPESVEEPQPYIAEGAEDDDEDEIIDMSNWNIPAWQDLIGSLYRPER